MKILQAGAILSLLLFTAVNGLAESESGLDVLLPCGSAGTQQLLPLDFHPQETDAWCWAAVAQIVMEYKETDSLNKDRLKVQCEPVTDVFRNDLNEKRLHTCCTKPKLDVCYKAYYSQKVFETYGFGWNWITEVAPSHLTWSNVTQQICSDKPFVPVVAQGTPPDGIDGYHSYVVYGFIAGDPTLPVQDNTNSVALYDPYDPSGVGRFIIKPFEIFKNDPEGEWVEGSYIDILPFPNP